ncbi:MAG: hypothetical protein ACM3ZB_10850 [bacterium]
MNERKHELRGLEIVGEPKFPRHFGARFRPNAIADTPTPPCELPRA